MQAKAPLDPTSTIAFSGRPNLAAPPARIAECVSECGLQIAGFVDLPELRRLAAELIGGSVMPASSLRAIQNKTGSTVLKYEQEGVITGGVAIAQLTPGGLDALLSGGFDPVLPCLDHYASPADDVAALYGLAIGGATREAAGAVVEGTVRLRAGIGGRLDFYACGATEAGRRLLTTRLDCVEVACGLFWSRPPSQQRAA